jgi:hypothetical protein
MTTLAREAHLNAEHVAAVARLDADLLIASGGAGHAPDVHDLRRHVSAAYRRALAGAAGVPADPRWNDLARAVGSFVECVAGQPPSFEAAEAIARLKLLRLELLPELLDLGCGIPRQTWIVQA